MSNFSLFCLFNPIVVCTENLKSFRIIAAFKPVIKSNSRRDATNALSVLSSMTINMVNFKCSQVTESTNFALWRNTTIMFKNFFLQLFISFFTKGYKMFSFLSVSLSTFNTQTRLTTIISSSLTRRMPVFSSKFYTTILTLMHAMTPKIILHCRYLRILLGRRKDGE